MGARRSLEQLVEDLRTLYAGSLGNRDQLSLLHEIAVYQEELIVQNEALLQAQSELEHTRDRFVELYDFAPTSYITLDQDGVIRECNLTATNLFGTSKPALIGLPLVRFVVAPDRDHYVKFLRRCRSGKEMHVECELAIRAQNGRRDVQLLCRPHASGNRKVREFFTSIVDVTERKHFERERTKAAHGAAALASRLISIQDDERQRIARNLHDDIGQHVTALRLRIENLVDAAATDSLREAVRCVQDLVEHLDGRLHFVATELRPFALDLGIVTAMEQFVSEWSTTFGIPADFRALGIDSGHLNPEIETHVYRIAQEALNNVAKHARATRVNVLLQHRADGEVLIVEDDGCGFDLSRVTRQEQRLGLAGMRERAHLIDGRLEIETRPGEGTAVFLHLPSSKPDP